MLYGLDFSMPYWLLGLGLLPLMFWVLYKLGIKSVADNLIADSKLLNYILVKPATRFKLKYLLMYISLLALMFICLADPKTNMRQYQVARPKEVLTIVLDLSQHMLAQDVAPNRLQRTKQLLTDILRAIPGVKVGLIAFAEHAHIVTPFSDDIATVEYLLQALHPEVMPVPGNRLYPALDLTATLQSAEAEAIHHVLLVSTGNLSDDVTKAVAKLNNSKLHVLAVGTQAGAPYPNRDGRLVQAVNRQPEISKINLQLLSHITSAGNGKLYLATKSGITTDFVGNFRNSQMDMGTDTVEQWDHDYYILLLPIILLTFIIGNFNLNGLLKKKPVQNFVTSLILLIVIAPFCGGRAYALELKSSRLTKKLETVLKPLVSKEKQGEFCYMQGDYAGAMQKFTDPYRRGVVAYMEEDYELAEMYFSRPQRSEVALYAEYNLGNALMQQHKFADAIKSYEKYLAQKPNDVAAEKNLALAKKLAKEHQDCPCKNNKPKKDNEDQTKNKESQAKNDNTEEPKQNEIAAKQNDSESTSDNSTKENSSNADKIAKQEDKSDTRGDDVKSQEDMAKQATTADTELTKEESTETNARATIQNEDGATVTDASKIKISELDKLVKHTRSDVRTLLRNKFYEEEKQHLRKRKDP